MANCTNGQPANGFSPFIKEFWDCMNDTVVHYTMLSRNEYGQKTYNDGTTYPNCRVVYKHELVRGPDGNEIVAKGVIWFGYYVNINPDQDKIVLPDGTDPPILMIEKYPDELGSNHTKLFFG
jgi:hypothetical protein